MPFFQYSARQSPESPLEMGRIEAVDLADARQVISQRLPVIEELSEIESTEPTTTVEAVLADSASQQTKPADKHEVLTAAETTEFATHITGVVASGAVFADGMRAAAAETDSPKLRRVFNRLAAKADQGQPLDTAMQGLAPNHLEHLLTGAARTGNLPHVMTELIKHYHSMRNLWASLRGALIYPVCLITAAIVILILSQHFIVLPVRDLMDEFGLSLPAATLWVFRAAEWMPPTALSALAVLGSSLVLLRLILGRGMWRVVFRYTPVLGALVQWGSLAEISRLLGSLLEVQTPLPDALQLTANARSSDGFRSSLLRMTHRVREGASLSQAAANESAIAPTMRSFIRWGEHSGQLAAGLQASAELCEERAQMRADLIRFFGPMLAYFTVAMVILGIAGSVFLAYSPMMSTMWGLS